MMETLPLNAEPLEVPVGVIHDVPAIMNAEARDLWVAALRSGNYKEGRHYLRTKDDHFDALGVLCDVAVQLGVLTWQIQPKSDHYHLFGFTTALPHRVREWAGFKGMHPSQDVPLTWNGDRHPVWRLSEWYRLDHDILANLIEDQY